MKIVNSDQTALMQNLLFANHIQKSWVPKFAHEINDVGALVALNRHCLCMPSSWCGQLTIYYQIVQFRDMVSLGHKAATYFKGLYGTN